MSDQEDKPQEDGQLKGGHLPAKVVGGVRMVNKPKEEKVATTPAKMTDEEKEEFGEEDKPVKKTTTAMVSGAIADAKEAFPTEAVKQFHDKPHPKVEKSHGNTKPNVIQQPRK